jgi:glucokinase
VGIDLGATNVRVARIVDGKIAELLSRKILNTDDAEDLLNQMADLIGLLLEPGVESIGLGVPSVVDVEHGVVYDVQNIPSWRKVPVKKFLEERLEIPVFVNNDANCFVLGEKYFGKGRDCQSLVGLVMGSGFGGGLVLNGRLYSGPHCGAGEVGMLPYRDSIFEHYCSGMFFEREYQTTGDEVFRQAMAGNEQALEVFRVLGTHIGNAIKAVMYAYDPEMIVLGGSVSDAYEFFKDSMYETLKDFAYSNSLEALHIEVSELDQVAVLGAAALALDRQQV